MDKSSGTFTATRASAPTPGDPGNSPNTGGDARFRAVAGDIYVADSSANSGTGAVYKINPENGQTTLVHQGPPFAGIRDIAFGPDGNLYVTDIGANAIHRIDLKNGIVTRLTQQFDPLLRNPWGIVYDPENPERNAADAGERQLESKHLQERPLPRAAGDCDRHDLHRLPLLRHRREPARAGQAASTAGWTAANPS